MFGIAYARQPVAKLHPFVNVSHHPNVARASRGSLVLFANFLYIRFDPRLVFSDGARAFRI